MADTTTNTVVETQTQEVIAETVAQVVTEIAALDVNDKKLSVKQVAEKLNEIVAALNKLQTTNTVSRDRGPKSEKEMTEDDARRVMMGDLEKLSHKAAAEKLGLSYGQVYSARKGFTFKGIYKEMNARPKAAE